jgi:hypothetical protein
MNKGRSAEWQAYCRFAWNRIRFASLCLGTFACLLMTVVTSSPLMAGTTEPNQLLRRPYPDWILSSENFKSNLIADETAESWFRTSETGLNVPELQKAPLAEETSGTRKPRQAAEASPEIPAPEPASTRIMIAMMGLLLCGWKLERRRPRNLSIQNQG